MFHNHIRREEDCKDTCRSKCEKHPNLCQLQLGVSLTSCISALSVFCSMLPSTDGFPLLPLSFFSLITPAFPRSTLSLLASLSPHPTTWPVPFHSHYYTGSSLPSFLNNSKSHSVSSESQSLWKVHLWVRCLHLGPSAVSRRAGKQNWVVWNMASSLILHGRVFGKASI